MMLAWMIANWAYTDLSCRYLSSKQCKEEQEEIELEKWVGNFHYYSYMQLCNFVLRLISSSFFAVGLTVIWRGLAKNDSELQRSWASFALHLVFLTLFSVFQVINLVTFYQSFSSTSKSGMEISISFILWSLGELINRIIMLHITEKVNKIYEN